jgi:hypothetical protein
MVAALHVFLLLLSEKSLQKPASQVPSAQTKGNRHPQHQRAKHNRKRRDNRLPGYA